MTVRVLAERYELRTVLGRGGMAQVWSAFDRRLGREVAVKLLDPAGVRESSTVARFDREARTVARLSHPNIVAVHDVGTDAGVPYLVMELVPGWSLADLLADGPVEVARAVDIAVQVCDALAAAHAAGVVHRDVKPANILLTGHDHVKVCDFGIARVADAEQVHLTASAQAIGTTAFMAPEQLSGQPVDARTDLYALGCVLFAMLTGAPPFVGDSPIQVAMQHLHQPAPRVSTLRPEVPPALDHLVAALLAKEPADRPATAAQVKAILAGPGPDRTTTMPALNQKPPVRASAAVRQPTRAMPAVIETDEPAPAGGGLRFGPGGVALIALAAAVVAAIVVALLITGRPDTSNQQATNPGITTAAASTETPPTTAPSKAATSDDAFAALTAAINEQRQTGELDNKTGRDLSKDADEIGREISRGDADKAADKTADLRRKLDEARDDDKISETGYAALIAATEQLAATLPQPENHD